MTNSFGCLLLFIKILNGRFGITAHSLQIAIADSFLMFNLVVTF